MLIINGSNISFCRDMDKDNLVKHIIDEQEELEEPNEERLLPIGGGSESRRGRHKSGKHQHLSLLDRVWQVLGTTEDQVTVSYVHTRTLQVPTLSFLGRLSATCWSRSVKSEQNQNCY